MDVDNDAPADQAQPVLPSHCNQGDQSNEEQEMYLLVDLPEYRGVDLFSRHDKITIEVCVSCRTAYFPLPHPPT